MGGWLPRSIHQLVGRMEVRLFSSIVRGGMSGPRLPRHAAAALRTTLHPDQKPTSFSLRARCFAHILSFRKGNVTFYLDAVTLATTTLPTCCLLFFSLTTSRIILLFFLKMNLLYYIQFEKPALSVHRRHWFALRCVQVQPSFS